MVCSWQIVLQNSKNAGRPIFRGKAKQATIGDQCSLKRVTGIACEFGARRRSPPHNYSIVRAYGSENLSPMPQKSLQHYRHQTDLTGPADQVLS
jgi:hypothetical protein